MMMMMMMMMARHVPYWDPTKDKRQYDETLDHDHTATAEPAPQYHHLHRRHHECQFHHRTYPSMMWEKIYRVDGMTLESYRMPERLVTDGPAVAVDNMLVGSYLCRSERRKRDASTCRSIG